VENFFRIHLRHIKLFKNIIVKKLFEIKYQKIEGKHFFNRNTLNFKKIINF